MSKKLLTPVLALVFIFSAALGIFGSGDSIDSIEVDVKLNDDGSADITQIWNAKPGKGTEFYIPIQYLNHMELENFYVEDETGTRYELKDYWDVNASFEDKAYKCGINYPGNGIELCWGKSEFKDKVYTIHFTYKNFVQSFSDYDGFNVRLVNDDMSPAPKRTKTVIHSDGLNFDESNSAIWAFGFKGTINFDNGNVIAYTDKFNSNSHMTVLMRLNKGLLHPTFTGVGSFSDLERTAKEGSDYDYKENGNYDSGYYGYPIEHYDLGFLGKFPKSMVNSIARTLMAFIVLFLFSTVVASRIVQNKKISNLNAVNFDEPEYYRERLCDSKLPALYYLASQKEINSELDRDIIGAFFLKWIKEKCLVPHTDVVKTGLFGTEKEMVTLEIKSEPHSGGSRVETILWNAVSAAAGEDRILQEKELKTYFKRSYNKYSALFNDIYTEGFKYLCNNGYVITEKGRFGREKHLLTEQGINELQNLHAFKRFLRDFTLIEERGANEAELWDYYLMVATLLGLGEKISKEFKELYPDYKYAGETEPYRVYNTTNYFAYSGLSGYNSGRRAEQATRSSGGGGFSSFGGGGGFSGGGHGGGGR